MILRAARSPHGLAEVRRLLAAGAAPDERASDGLTALQLACGRDDEPMVRELLAAGADAAASNFRKRSALHEACADGGQLAIVELLLAHGASARVADADGNTPLHTLVGARRLSDAALVAALLRAGADPNAPNLSGLTPLHVACTQGHAPAVRLLLAAGADVHARCKLGTPLALCVWGRVHAAVLESLVAAGASVRGEGLLHLVLRAADHHGHVDESVQTLQHLIALGCDVEEADERGAGALHIAVLHRRTRHVVALLEAGANPMRPDDLGLSSVALCASVLAHSAAPALVAILALLLFAAGRSPAAEMTVLQLEALGIAPASPQATAAALRQLRNGSAPQKLL